MSRSLIVVLSKMISFVPEEEDEFNPPDMKDEEPLINLDSIVLQDAEENFTLPPPSAQRQQLTKNQALSTQMEAKVSLPKKY